MLDPRFRSLSFLSLLAATGAAAACSAGAIPGENGGTGAAVVQPDGSGGGNATGAGGSVGVGGGLDVGGPGPSGPGANPNAFPSDAIVEAGVDAAAISAFDADATVGSGVCVFEPHLSDANGPGALFPENWLRPRFRWEGEGATWEIKLEAAGQSNPLRAYTTQKEWTMPRELWDTISKGVQDTDITVTIRSNTGSGTTGGTFRITGALAGGSMVFWGTTGSEVAQGASSLYGFTMGDEVVVDTLATEQITSIDKVITGNGADLRGEKVGDAVDGFDPGKPRCVGCHRATPDGEAMIFTDDYPWDIGVASVVDGSTGTAPTYVTAGARKFLKMPFLGTGMMLPAAWESGDRTLITTMGRRSGHVYINYGYNEPPTYEPLQHDLIWIDLETSETYNDTLPAATEAGTTGAPPWNVDYTGYERQEAATARDAEIRAARGDAYDVLYSEPGKSISNPSPGKKSLQVAFSVSESSIDGHPDWDNNTSDIKVLSLSSPRAAGTARAVDGASDPTMLEYYPEFSPDDVFLAFNRAPAPTYTDRCRQGNPSVHDDKDSVTCDNYGRDLGPNPDGPYYNRNGEVWVVPSAGGVAHRLRGNDPVACSGEVSPGVLNSWPKWSSAVREHNGKQYYFVIFSSARAYPGQFELGRTEYTPPIETKSSQLYMSTIEVDPATGTMTSYGAIYLWNQNYRAVPGTTTYEELKTANMTPAWEDFSIPEVPDIVVVK